MLQRWCCALVILWASTAYSYAQTPKLRSQSVTSEASAFSPCHVPGLEIGMNVSGIGPFQTNRALLNLFKAAKPFEVYVAGKRINFQDAQDLGYLDARGWPKDPPLRSLIASRLFTYTGIEDPVMKGRYLLRYQGAGAFEVAGSGIVPGSVEKGEDWILFDYTGLGDVDLRIRWIEKPGPVAPDWDIILVREEYYPLLLQGEIFHPEYLDIIKDYAVLRFLSWYSVNGSTLRDIADAPSLDNAFYSVKASGMPLAIILALANKVGADPWLNIPHLASDDYIRAFVREVRDTLDPRLTPYFEWSNEVWNRGFAQHRYAKKQAERLGMGGKHPAILRYQTRRAAEMAQIVDDIYQDHKGQPPYNVLAGQLVGFRVEIMLKTMVRNKNGQMVQAGRSGLFDYFATDNYFGHPIRAGQYATILGLNDVQLSLLDINQLDADEQDRILASLQSVVIRSNQRRLARLKDVAAVLADYDMPMISYEAGTHISPFQEDTERKWLVDLLQAYNYSHHVVPFYERMAEAFAAAGGELLMYFVGVAQPTKNGSYGHYRHFRDNNPRSNLIEKWLRQKRLCAAPMP